MNQEEVAEAFLVDGDKIRSVGTSADVLGEGDHTVDTIDLQGATVIPGLIDAHSHIEMLAFAWEISEDVRSSRVSSIEDLIDVLRIRASNTAEGDWIIGHGQHFQDALFKEGRYPDRHDLDRVSTRHPVMYRSSFHTNVFNSLALQLMDVDRNTQDAPGGRIERDSDGNPTGRTFDMYAELGGPQISVEELANAINRVQNKYLEVGVTSLGEISLLPSGLDALIKIAREGDLHLRVASYVTAPNICEARDVLNGALAEKFEGIDPEILNFAGIKLFLDGGLTSLAAALNDDYPNQPGYRGEMVYSLQELQEWIELVTGAGLQIAIHAIGDRALDQALDAVAETGEKARHLRHRIEHAGNIWMSPERIKRLSDLGVIPVPQPAFILTTALGYRDNLGARIGDLMPFRTMLDAGLRLPGNSDAIGITEDQHDPFPAIQASITRTTYDGQPVDTHQGITIFEALRMYSIDAAFAIGREAEIGSIAPGKKADFVILDEDLLGVSPSSIGQIQPRETWVGGQKIYSRSQPSIA